MPPPALLVPNCPTPETKMPLATALVIVPLLVMPPVKVGPVIETPVPVALILLALSIRMPWLVPRITPLSMIAPVIVLPATGRRSRH